jgi:hypothetical protein
VNFSLPNSRSSGCSRFHFLRFFDASRTNQTNKGSPATGGLNPSTLPGDPCKTRFDRAELSVL